MAAKTSLADPFRKPSPLRRGDRVAVIAPSGPVPSERLSVGLAVLSARHPVLQSDGLLSKRGFLAGDDGRRLAELRWALSDPQVQAVFCARGGHGALRLLPLLLNMEPSELPIRPLVGFSDVTVLHALCALHRRVTIHGPVVTQLGELSESDQSSLWSLLEGVLPSPMTELMSIGPPLPPVRGRLLGGNLEVLSRLCGTALQAALTQSGPVVLLIEEVTEAPYRIDRALTQLLVSGALRCVVAVVVGDLVRCEGPAEHPTALAVIAERLSGLGVPIVAGLPLGHGARNRAVPLGVEVEVCARRGALSFVEACVT